MNPAYFRALLSGWLALALFDTALAAETNSTATIEGRVLKTPPGPDPPENRVSYQSLNHLLCL